MFLHCVALNFRWSLSSIIPLEPHHNNCRQNDSEKQVFLFHLLLFLISYCTLLLTLLSEVSNAGLFLIKIFSARYICQLAVLQPTFAIILRYVLDLRLVAQGHNHWFPTDDSVKFFLLLAIALYKAHIKSSLHQHIENR